MRHGDFFDTWAARLACPTQTEAAILAALDGAPRRPESLDGFCHALFVLREHWTGEAPAQAQEEAGDITGADLSLAELEAASPDGERFGPNGRRLVRNIGDRIRADAMKG